jgi:glycine/D-amino acid oxidase-like deaminating enzyme
MSRRILVVGAGIVGAAIADRLQASGCSVTLFEAGIPGGGATAAAMGHVVTLDDSPTQLALCARGQALWKQEDLPASCEREATGTLWVASDLEELEEAHAKLERYIHAGIDVEMVDANRLRQLEPALRPGLAGGLRVPGDEVIYPVGGARFLLARARARGASLRREEVLEVRPGGVLTDSGWHLGDAVVLAAGLGITRLLPGLPIQPRKGHLAITGRVPGMVHHQLVELGYLKSAHGREAASVAFNVQPRATGQLLIGSSREFTGHDGSINRELLGRMLKKALSYLPSLEQVPVIRTWTGFRPCGPGNLPVIGPWPGSSGLFVAAGHEGLGITTATVTAELISHHVLGMPTFLDPSPFLPRVAHG